LHPAAPTEPGIRGEHPRRSALARSPGSAKHHARDSPFLSVPRTAFSIHDYCDQLRILISLRGASFEPQRLVNAQIIHTTDLVLAHQRQDGSITCDTHRFVPVDATAKALIALADAGHPQDDHIDAALMFLSHQIRSDGSVNSAADAIDEGWPGGPELRTALRERLGHDGIRRNHPAALVLSALARWEGHEADTDLVKSFLLRQYDLGWGPFPEAHPRPAYTALVLRALLAAGEEPMHFDRALRFLRSCQRRGGRWAVEEEVWSVQSAYGVHPTLTRIDTTTCSLEALASADEPTAYPAITRGIRHLERTMRFDDRHSLHGSPHHHLISGSVPPNRASGRAAATVARVRAMLPSPGRAIAKCAEPVVLFALGAATIVASVLILI
jgi:hypothetical protein